MNLAITVIALSFESIVGYPKRLFSVIGHPVTWIGALITKLDSMMNREADSARTRRQAGVAASAMILIAAMLPAALIQTMLFHALPTLVAVVACAVLASTLLASRSLAEHVEAVADAMEADGLAGGREAVSRIVGRNPATLDEAGVLRAAIESLAENFSDGVVAPALWCALLGLPGIALYKAANTADSMIGHRTPRHAAFGWAAARFDDLINLPASRLSACWIMLASVLTRDAMPRAALAAVRRDAYRHRSPNAGFPEAAMAGALGLRLAGPRVYGTIRVDDAWMGDGRAAATIEDLRRALALYRRACAIQLAFAAIVAWFIGPE